MERAKGKPKADFKKFVLGNLMMVDCADKDNECQDCITGYGVCGVKRSLR